MGSGNSEACEVSVSAYFATDSQSTLPTKTVQWLNEMWVGVFCLVQIGVRCFLRGRGSFVFLKISLYGFNRLYAGIYIYIYIYIYIQKRVNPTAGVKGCFRQWAPFWSPARAARSIWIRLRLALCRPGVWRAIERLFNPPFLLFLLLNISEGTNAGFNDLRITDFVICTPRRLYFVITSRMRRLSDLRHFVLLFPFLEPIFL